MEVLGRLATAVIHDLNNLLTVIQLNAGLIEGGGLEAEELTDSAGKISEASARAADLTRKVLHFARRKPSELQTLDLHEVFDGLARLLEPLVARRAEIRVSGDRGACHVRGERGAIEQAILNLVLNAVEAMPGGGTIDIAARVETLPGADGARATKGVLISVADEGEGIPAELGDSIFAPFYTSKSSGTGMGLAIVQRVAESHGGRVSFRARPSGGTEFLLRLPAAAEAGERDAAGTATHPSRVSGTVLFIEDDPGIRELTRGLLVNDGLTVLTAATGEEGLEVWRAHRDEISLLFTDVVLPGISGTDVAREVLADKPGLPVLYMSGFAGAWGENAGFGEQNFLAKPFRREELRRAVGGLLR